MIYWKHQTFKLYRKFSKTIVFKIRVFKLSDIDQGIYKHSIQKIWVFSLFEKSYSERRKKNLTFVYPGLRYEDKKEKFASKFFFSENVCLSTKFDLLLKKKKKKLGAIKILLGKKFVVVIIKKVLVIQFTYMEIVWKAFFFKKNILNQFFVTSLINCSPKAAKMVYFFLLFFENVWKLYDMHFHGDIWSMELYDKRFRCMEL